LRHATFPVPSYERQEDKKRFADVREVKRKTLEVLNNISTKNISKNDSSSGKNVGTMYRVERRVL
jgi:hypothetical protein